MVDRASYSVCGKPAKSKLLGLFLNHFYKVCTLTKVVNGVTYIIEYCRSPFWAYEEPSLRLFVKEKLITWHGQVWELLPRGSRCGFGTICIGALFPVKRMSNFLDRESKYVYNACYGKDKDEYNNI